MHAAEDDEIGVGLAGRLLGKQEGIALEVSVLYDLFPLVMVTEHSHRATQFLTGVMDALVEFISGAMKVLGGDLLPAYVYRQLFRQWLGRQFVFRLTEGGML
jgi:hypothetical protein